jgi:hypothetical protein
MWRWAHFGQLFTVLSAKKLGTVIRQTISAVSKIAAVFHRLT